MAVPVTSDLAMVHVMPVSSSMDSSVGDTIFLVLWALLALVSWLLVLRLPAGRRGAWLLVSTYCTIVALDKVIDLQMALFVSVRWSIDLLDPWFGLRQHRLVVRVLVLLTLAGLAIAGTVLLARRDLYLDRGKKVAISGMLLVLLLVAARLVPGLSAVFSDNLCWIFEGISCLLIVGGMRSGFTDARGTSQ